VNTRQCVAKDRLRLIRSRRERRVPDSICPHDYEVMTARKISITHVISLSTHDLDVGVCLARSLARLIDVSVATAHMRTRRTLARSIPSGCPLQPRLCAKTGK
jgi:hypothetical protein